MKTLSETLAKAAWVDSICQLFAPHAWQDLRQDLFLMIVDSPKVTARAERALELGCLEYFYLNCAKNLTRKHGHVTRYFHPWTNNEADVYNLPLADYSDTERPQDEETESQQLEAVAETYAGLDWYERGLIDLHMNGWSDREIYRRTGITDKEVRRVLRKFRADVLKNFVA